MSCHAFLKLVLLVREYSAVQETAKHPAVSLTSVEHHRCSNEAKTRNPLKLARVPQTYETISAARGPKFTILWWHVGETLLLNNFLQIVNMCVSCEDIARQSCGMVPRWQIFGDFLAPAFPASRVQHISDLYSKFPLGPHHVW